MTFRTWNGFVIESKEFAGNAIHVDQTSGDVSIKVIDNSTMEQLLVLNKEGELTNHETDKFVISDSNKVISSDEAATKWELGTFSNEPSHILIRLVLLFNLLSLINRSFSTL